jgi:hypothetical protein
VRGSDAEIEEAIAVLCLTTLGERPMLPTYGVPDPAFAGLHVGDIQVGLDEHGPDGVTITGVEQSPVSNTQSAAEVTWSRTKGTP